MLASGLILCLTSIHNPLLSQSLAVMEKAFHVMRCYSGMKAVTGDCTEEWVNRLMIVVCYLKQPGPCQTCAWGGEGEWMVVGNEAEVWGLDGKERENQKKSIFAGFMKNLWAFKLVVWRCWAAFLPCCVPLRVPFISCKNPSCTVLTLELFVIQTEKQRGFITGEFLTIGEFGLHHVAVHTLSWMTFSIVPH